MKTARWNLEVNRRTATPLIACLGDSDPGIAVDTADVASMFNLSPGARAIVVPEVRRLLTRSLTPELRARLLTAAARIPSERLRRHLRELAGGPEALVVLEALALAGDMFAKEPLAALAASSDRVRARALRSLSRFGANAPPLPEGKSTPAGVATEIWEAIHHAAHGRPSALAELCSRNVDWPYDDGDAAAEPSALFRAINSWPSELRASTLEALQRAPLPAAKTELVWELLGLLHQPAPDVAADPPPTATIATADEANDLVRHWMKSPLWDDPERWWLTTERARSADPKLLGELVAHTFEVHIEEVRKIAAGFGVDFNNPGIPLDDGNGPALAIGNLVQLAELDVSRLFEIWRIAHPGSKQQIAEAIGDAEGCTVVSVLGTMGGALSSANTRSEACAFLKLIIEFEGFGVRGWGGGSTPTPQDNAEIPAGSSQWVEKSAVLSSQEEIQPGVAFDLIVNLIDHKAGATSVTLPVAEDWETLVVTARVFAPRLTIYSAPVAQLHLQRSGPSTPVTFVLEIPPGNPELVADVLVLFFVDGTFCGNASRVISASEKTQAPSEGDTIQLPVAVDEDPIFTVTILESDGSLAWHCDYGDPDAESSIELGTEALTFARQLSFEADSDLSRAYFEGLGEVLLERAPARFRSAYAAALQDLGPGFPVQFVTNDPYIPWELMGTPDKPGNVLAVDHAVARSLLPQDGARTWIAQGSVLTCAPAYEGERRLPEAQKEADSLVAALGAMKLTPATRNNFLAVLEKEEPISVLHFAGHGEESGEGMAVLSFEDGQDLRLLEIRRSALKRAMAGTLVVLNACFSGSAASTLRKYFGWAEAFMWLGCSGYVGPLWSVDDVQAGPLAAELLEAVVKQGVTVAEALRRIRQDRLEGMRYIFVGDVRLRLAQKSDLAH